MRTADHTAEITLAERVARRTRQTLMVLADTAGGERPQTPDLTPEQIALHGPHLVACLRLIVEQWVSCGGPVPQLLSVDIMRAKSALLGATATTEGGGDA